MESQAPAPLLKPNSQNTFLRAKTIAKTSLMDKRTVNSTISITNNKNPQNSLLQRHKTEKCC